MKGAARLGVSLPQSHASLMMKPKAQVNFITHTAQPEDKLSMEVVVIYTRLGLLLPNLKHLDIIT